MSDEDWEWAERGFSPNDNGKFEPRESDPLRISELEKQMERVCCINHIVLKDVRRPSLHCEEINQDGDYKQGRSCFSAVLFSAEIDPFDYTGNFSQVTLNVSPFEKWIFFDAKIALMPETMIDRSNFVMVFDRCERASTSS